MNVYSHGKQAPPTPPLCATRSSSLEVRGGRVEKMLTVRLSPGKCPPPLLSRPTRYHDNAAVTESLLLAPHSGSATPLQRGHCGCISKSRNQSETNERELNSAILKQHQ